MYECHTKGGVTFICVGRDGTMSKVLWKICMPPIRTQKGKRDLANRQNFGETVWRDSYKNRGVRQHSAEQSRTRRSMGEPRMLI